MSKLAVLVWGVATDQNLGAAIGFNPCASEPESELCGKQTFPFLNIIMVMSETALQL
jgi:hypothetical protein